MRAKVCSKGSSGNDKFLFNTWQQFADRRIRQRDVLLSKKVMTSEVPLNDQALNIVGSRAVTEVMSQFHGQHYKLQEDRPPPSPSVGSPVRVLEVMYDDHSYEIEESPSY